MGKFFVGLLFLLALTLTALYFSSAWIVSSALTHIVGSPVEVGHVHIGLFSSELAVYEIRIKNPEPFDEPILAYIPELYMKGDFTSLRRGLLELKTVRFWVQEITVERNSQGLVNLVQLEPFRTLNRASVRLSSKGKGLHKFIPGIRLLVHEVHFRMGKVHFMDRFRKPLLSQEYDLSVEEQVARDITNPKTLTADVVGIVLQRVGMGDLFSKIDWGKALAPDNTGALSPLRTNLPL